MWIYGSIPIFMYPIMGEEVNPMQGFLLITDGTDFLLSDNTPMELAN